MVLAQRDFIGRRELLAALGGAVAAWPLAARAQQPAMPVIGFLHGASPDGYRPMVAAFRQGLEQSGYVEGQNVAVEYRTSFGQSSICTRATSRLRPGSSP